MPRLILLALVWFFVCRSTLTEAQPILLGCPRPVIETYPEEKKHLAVQFLDEARAFSDSSAPLFAQGRFQELYARTSTDFKRLHTEEKFREMMANIQRTEGNILAREYKHQNLVYAPGQLQDFTSLVQYAVKTTKQEDDAVLEIRTRQQGTELVIDEVSIRHFDLNVPEPQRCTALFDR